MLAEMDFLSLFAETGLPSVHSFTTEIVQRLAAKVVPSAREDTDARKLLIDLYSSERYARQFAALSPEIFERIVNVLTPGDAPEFWQRQERDLDEAMRLLVSANQRPGAATGDAGALDGVGDRALALLRTGTCDRGVGSAQFAGVRSGGARRLEAGRGPLPRRDGSGLRAHGVGRASASSWSST